MGSDRYEVVYEGGSWRVYDRVEEVYIGFNFDDRAIAEEVAYAAETASNDPYDAL